MNHTYRVVFNESTKTYVAVSENEPAKGKSKSVKKALAAAVALTFGG
ncbi:ESPR domain-containing protein, partial [Conchiformibius steedae]